MDRTMVEHSLLERINIDKSGISRDTNKSHLSHDNTHSHQIVTLREGNNVINENDEFGSQYSDPMFNSQYFNHLNEDDDEYMNDDEPIGIDIGLFKGKMNMDFDTLTKVCQLINHFSKSKGQIDNIKERDDQLYSNFNVDRITNG